MERLNDEQVRLINEIWDVIELLDPDLDKDQSLESLKARTMENDVTLPDNKLRRVLLDLKTRHRKGEVVQAALVES